MNCDEVRQFLHAYVDDELDITAALQIEKHLPGCPTCRKELEAAQVIGRALSQPAMYYPASSELRDRLQRAIRAEAREMEASAKPRIVTAWWMRPMAFSSLAAGLLVVISSAMLYLSSGAPSGQIDELVASHVRSLEADHLLDVASTDQHTVKPWFDGKIDFAPPVIDLAPAGFPLIGGRLDYLHEGKVAALIYHRNKHVINLFIWPGDTVPESEVRQGYNLIRFECKGMVCWAVSDVNAAELQQFVDLFKAQKSPSTRS
jgi:anti-sigma factor RsiW